ncbi:hypothetical protein FB451DRAFT_1560655 [Mycena latifolia]|nr:hypothetical protein FB451DRAFT_1560655 [Mycena latifolia]
MYSSASHKELCVRFPPQVASRSPASVPRALLPVVYRHPSSAAGALERGCAYLRRVYTTRTPTVRAHSSPPRPACASAQHVSALFAMLTFVTEAPVNPRPVVRVRLALLQVGAVHSPVCPPPRGLRPSPAPAPPSHFARGADLAQRVGRRGTADGCPRRALDASATAARERYVPSEDSARLSVAARAKEASGGGTGNSVRAGARRRTREARAAGMFARGVGGTENRSGHESAGEMEKEEEDFAMGGSGAEDTRPEETPRTGTGTRTAACAACAVPALYGTQRTRKVTGKAGCAREGRGGDGEHGQERPRLLRPTGAGAAEVPVLELSSPRSPPYALHLGHTADPPLHVRLPSPRFASFLPRARK